MNLCPCHGTGECVTDSGGIPEVVSLILVGRSGAGKSTTGQGLAMLTGRPLIEIGAFVRRDAAAAGRTPLRQAQKTFASGEYTRFARDAVAAARTQSVACIIVGPRMPVELEFMRRELGPTFSIGLLLPDPERRSRLALRVESSTFPDQPGRDDVEEAWGISRTLADCDSFVYTAADRQTVVNACLREWLAADSERNRRG
jgi:hypothetical protein